MAKTKAKAYKVFFPLDVNEKRKGVVFCHGTGVLDLQAIAEWRGEWFRTNDAGELIQIAGVPISDLFRYFQKKGAKISEISADDAASLRLKIDESPDELLADLPGFAGGSDESSDRPDTWPDGSQVRYDAKGQAIPQDEGSATPEPMKTATGKGSKIPTKASPSPKDPGGDDPDPEKKADEDGKAPHDE